MHFKWINSFNLHDHLEGRFYVDAPLLDEETEIEKTNKLPQVTQLVCDEAGTQT